jgi:uncharacterized protein YegJ (DUF2314 family)
MSDSKPSKVYMFEGADPEMQRAYSQARATFRYFWREVAWDRRRIIPALNLACVKASFSDGEPATHGDEAPEVEHMWLSDIDFDGECVSGVLQNTPNWLKSIKQGDSVRIPLHEIEDWMYALDDEVFGAYTVNLMRSRMGRQERNEHDAAWGVNFGDPAKIRLVPEPGGGGGLLKRWFGARQAETAEHPMSESMASVFKDEIAKNPSLVSSTDGDGWTLLHQQVLAGSAATVKVLLEAGADPHALTHDGKTPLALAKALGWDSVVALLSGK